ncbi:LuxR C-terminal-related transcriptional regulator [Propioniciclava soli]|uniref:LuxR C-terminal-related transcriptional regulator n=1 Tax=Propioniciclava soli TaxID=2775081 RepID=A0ABZ3CC38_9ACTN
MTLDPSPLPRAAAPRLAPRFHHATATAVHAPAEYWPAALTAAALAHATGRPPVRLHLPGDAAHLPGALAGASPVLVLVDDPAAAPVAAEEVRRVATSDPPASVWAVVCAGDATPTEAQLAAFDLVLDHRDLTLTTAEVLSALPCTPTTDEAHALLAATGGVPALVGPWTRAGPKPTDPEPRDATLSHTAPQDPAFRDRATATMTRLARAWADRSAAAVAADPLLGLHVWCGRLHEESVALLASRLAAAPVPLAAVRRTRSCSLVTRVDGHDPALPGALAAALQAGPRRAAPGRKAVVAAALAAPVPALEAVRLFTRLGAWAALDHVLGTAAHLLVHLTPAQRRRCASAWPSPVPERLTHLAAGRRFVDPQEPRPSAPGVLNGWLDLGRLHLAEAPQRGGPSQAVREQITRVIAPGRPWTQAEASADLATVHTFLTDLCHQVESAGVRARADEAASLISLSLAASEAAVRIGDLQVALSLVRLATRLMHALGTRAAWFPLLRPSVLAHAAFTSAVVGSPAVATVRLESYAHHTHADPPDETTAELADLAARLVALDRGSIPADAPLEFVDTERDFAPEDALARARGVLLRHGPAAAAEWLHAMLGRAAWTESPAWAWWGLRAALVLLHARAGQPGRAQQVLERAPLPPALGMAVRAHLALAGGHPAAAEKMAHEVLALADLAPHWRLLALGARLEALLADGRRAESEVALAAEPWDEQVGTVALFPDRVRALVTARLASPAVRALPGLAADAAPPVLPDVKLTRRQLDVLRALATDATMAQVAQELFLGTETVRSTAKELYRRLGVHDRHSAVEVGRALGLL